ncbi:DUF393 domain-containing protein [bacterium]|nr:DUF393 domain-containing protein [bacterium]
MVKAFYDGACYVCDGEVNLYKKHNSRIEWINIAEPGFDAEKYQLTAQEVDASLHTIDEHGTVYKGVDSFILIWNHLPKPYPYFSKIIKLPIIYGLAKIAYACFAKLRVYLPKKNVCEINPKQDKDPS